MKKFYSLVLMAAALLIGTNMRAVEVNDLAGLQGALETGGDITLTADINAGTTQLVITKGITLNGNGFCVKGTGTNVHVFRVSTADAVVMENLIIWASKTSKKGRGILISNETEGENGNNANLTLNNVTINATYRAMDVWYADGVVLNINNCVFQNVQGQAKDAQGNPTSANYDIELTGTNASDTRGVNFGQLTNSTITITNSTMQGFFYVLNNVTGDNGDMTGTKLTATNSTFKGRAALNVWGFGGDYTFTDCSVIGINNYGGSQEGFSCFVFNNQSTCHDNKLTINGGTVVSAVFDAVGGSNPNANQYMIDDRATNNTIVINNSSYSCTKDLGDDKGGIIYQVQPTSDITINGGNYDCPNIVSHTYSDGEGNTGSLVITGGEFIVSTVSPDMTDGDMYKTIEVQGGTYAITETDPVTGETTVVDIKDLADPTDPTNTLISSDAITTIINQDSTVTVVPKGTEQKTVDPAVKTDLVWGTDVVTDANSNVVLQADQTLTLASGSARAYKLDLAAGAKIVVKNGAKLTLGKGGASFANSGATKPQIIVEQGGTLVVYGPMYSSEKENLLVKASADAYGILIFDPDMNTYGDNHPKGTVEFVTKSFYQDAEHYQFERFGIPTYNALESITGSIANTGIYIYENNNWSDLGYLKNDAVFANTARLNKPFVACNLIAYQAAAGATYTFGGALNGNSNAVLNCNLEWNPLANSYTAEVDVEKYLEALASGVNVDHTIYLATPTGLGTYSWDPVDAEWAAGEKLKPMQAFILHNHGTDPEESVINYKNTVWTPAAPAGAPARRSAATEHSAKMRIVVTRGEYTMDNLKMMESATNNHNAVKFMNDDVNIYATSDDKYGIVASEDLNDTYVGFSTVKGGEFTINFTNVDGRNFDIIDLENGARINVMEGSEYTFTTAANYSNEYRFKIVEREEVATDIENTEAVKSVKGIYTITGQYVGEMNVWNTLPAGVYVVDGAKRVK